MELKLSSRQTDNSNLVNKVKLRLDAINKIGSEVVVLECFAGSGKVWRIVKMLSDKDISIVKIEKEKGKSIDIALPGDNKKYLKKMDLSKFDIIDLDSYGIPFDQLEIIFSRNYRGIVIVTAIQSVMGRIPNKLLRENGITDRMISAVPSIFFKKCLDFIRGYLYNNNVREICDCSVNLKNYFYFRIGGKGNVGNLSAKGEGP